MSSTQRFYVGPYVECKAELVDEVRERITCPNTDCPSHKSTWNGTNFCPRCGSRIQPVQHTVKVNPINLYKIDDMVYEKLLLVDDNPQRDTHYWVLNTEDSNKYYVKTYGNNGAAVRIIDPGDRTLELQDFSRQTAEGIDILVKMYGVGNVNIRWGTLYWID